MKKIIKITLITFFIGCLKTIGIAQVDSVRVYDLSVIIEPQLVPRVEGANTPSPIQSDKTINISFKVSNPDSTDEVYIQVGTTINGSDLHNKTFIMQKHNGKSFLYANGVEVAEFWDKSVSYKVTLNNNTQEKWIAVWIKSARGILSSKKYFKIH